MVGRPLSQNFRIKTRINDFVGRRSSEMVGRDVSDAIAAGLDGVQIGFG